MVNLSTQRRMAAEILGVGENRIWIDPERIEDVAMAVTRKDVKALIKEKAIKKRPKKGISRARAKKRHMQKKKGRMRGPGKRKGAKGAKTTKKERWIQRIRPIRRKLRELRDKGKIDNSTYRKLYRKSKGGIFKSTSHLLAYMKEHEVLEEQ